MEVDPLEVWMIAGLLVDEHGRRAGMLAKERAEKALGEDDIEGSIVWRAIMDAAEAYLDGEVSEGKEFR